MIRCVVILPNGRECPHKAKTIINKMALCEKHAKELRETGHVNTKRKRR